MGPKHSSDALTAEHLRSICVYSPETGVFHRFDSYKKRLKTTPWGNPDPLGYLRVAIHKYGYYKIHRLAWLYFYGDWPTKAIDHINGIKSDNRICNLREATYSENAFNRYRPRPGSKSGYMGVSMARNRWRADFGGKNLGLYNTPEEAHEAYLEAKAKALGDSCPAVRVLLKERLEVTTNQRFFSQSEVDAEIAEKIAHRDLELDRLREALNQAGKALLQIVPASSDDEDLAHMEHLRTSALNGVRWALTPTNQEPAQ